VSASDELLADLEAGRRRAAWPDASVPGGWRVDPAVKEEILALFASDNRDWSLAGTFHFRDRASLPTQPPAEGVRIVPGGTTVRRGAHLASGVVVMPPAFVNVGAFIGEGTMVDSHALVGSCAQIGARVHLAAAVQIGGVLEPAGARPVVVEDDAFIGAGCLLLEGVLVGAGAVLGAGVLLTGTSRLYDVVEERMLQGTPESPLVVPPRAVVVPGSRAVPGAFAESHGLGVATALIVKRRDARTDARTALEEFLR
jgi:2,3,4,5-tetrahydropyridine-2-carboxylate N-succinyltransferase